MLHLVPPKRLLALRLRRAAKPPPLLLQRLLLKIFARQFFGRRTWVSALVWVCVSKCWLSYVKLTTFSIWWGKLLASYAKLYKWTFDITNRSENYVKKQSLVLRTWQVFPSSFHLVLSWCHKSTFASRDTFSKGRCARSTLVLKGNILWPQLVKHVLQFCNLCEEGLHRFKVQELAC